MISVHTTLMLGLFIVGAIEIYILLSMIRVEYLRRCHL